MKTRSELGQNLPEEIVVAKLGKTHEGYWKSRLRRRTFRGTDDILAEVPEWQVKLYRDGRQLWVNLGTADKTKAARAARDHWLKLKTQGWEVHPPGRYTVFRPHHRGIEAIPAELRENSQDHSLFYRLLIRKFVFL